jgi:hypothetical protein
LRASCAVSWGNPALPCALLIARSFHERGGSMQLGDYLEIDISFLPPYSPNLNLIGHLWRFVQKKCLYKRYHEAFCHFKAAIGECLEKVKSNFSEQVKTLLNPKFQLFENPQA